MLKYSEWVTHSLRKSNKMRLCMKRYIDIQFAWICLSNEPIDDLKVTIQLCRGSDDSAVSLCRVKKQQAGPNLCLSSMCFTFIILLSTWCQQIWFNRMAMIKKYYLLLSCFQQVQPQWAPLQSVLLINAVWPCLVLTVVPTFRAPQSLG